MEKIVTGVLIALVLNIGLLTFQTREDIRVAAIERQVNLIDDCQQDLEKRGILLKEYRGCLEY